MLAAGQRLRSSAEFSAVMKGGARSGRPTVVVYIAHTGNATRMAGFAVSRAVGGAVVRNTVKRRLRAIARDLLPTLDEGVGMVVRALPPAAHASFAQLRDEVSSAALSAQSKAA